MGKRARWLETLFSHLLHVARVASGRALGPSGMESGPLCTPTATDLSSRLVFRFNPSSREPPFAPVDPHGVEVGGSDDERREGIPEVAGVEQSAVVDVSASVMP